MHFFKDGCHTVLCILLFSHLGKLALGNCSLLVSLLKSLMRQEVLSHDPRDLLEVIKNSQTSVLYFLFRWAEPAEIVV